MPDHDPSSKKNDPEKQNFLNFRKGSASLRRTLFFWFLFIATIPLFLLSGLNYYQARRDITETTHQNLELEAQLKVEALDRFFRQRVKDLHYESQHTDNLKFFRLLKTSWSDSQSSLKDWVQSVTWKTLSDQYGQDLRRFKDVYQISDILMLDARGNILFTVAKDADLGINLFQTAYQNTNFSQTIQQVLLTRQIRLSDLEFYPAAQDKVVGFLIAPIMENDTVSGLLAIRFPQERIHEILHNEHAPHREAYLVGGDQLMRSNSHLSTEPTVLRQPVNSALLNIKRKNWLSQEKHENFQFETRLYDDYRGVPVIGVLRHSDEIFSLGVHWDLIAEIDQTEAFADLAQLRNTLLLILLFALTGVFLLTWLVSRWITRPLIHVSNWAQRVAKGELTDEAYEVPNNEIGTVYHSFQQVVGSFRQITEVSSSIAQGDLSRSIALRSDTDTMGEAVNAMRASLVAVVQQAQTIASGNYSVELTPRSEHDQLGLALMTMTRTLRQYHHETQRQNWFREGYGKLSDVMRGELSLKTLSQNILNFLTAYLNAQTGAFYILDKDQTLVLKSHYAQPVQQPYPERLLPGQTLLGQAALQKTTLLIKDVPADYRPVSSGTGAVTPGSLLIVPILLEKKLEGVIELGSLHEFTPQHLEFMNQTQENIAIALHSAQSRMKMKELLETSQRQTEELQRQQEELSQVNEELMNQTDALKKSEKELQQQQEELRVTNQELEERSHEMEQQHKMIEQKNRVLEETQQTLEEKATALEISNRYKSEFLANMSHELRTPLNSLLLLADSLSRNKEGNLNEKQVQFAHMIHESGMDLLTLINDILDLSKIEAGKMTLHMEDVRMESVLAYIQRVFQPAIAKKGLLFQIHAEQEALRTLQTDHTKLEQILKNFISNALKFTQHGSITVHLYQPTFPDNEYLAFAVIDTGIGIAQNKQELVFEAFQQENGATNRKYGGTGLGLYICQKLADMLGGRIELESEQGKGSTFTLYIPHSLPVSTSLPTPVPDNSVKQQLLAAKVSEQPATSEPPATKPAIPEKENHPASMSFQDDRDQLFPDSQVFLLIEDDVRFALSALEIAHERNIKLIHAGDGRQGIKIARQYLPHAIILDVELPQMDGWNVMDELTRSPETRHIPVHFISSEDQGMKGMQMGAIGFVKKPVTPDKFHELFQSLENSRIPKQKKVLIAEDKQELRDAMMELASFTEADAFVATTGNKALELLKQQRFDCIIMDIQLKDMSGLEFLELIQQQSERALPPVIVYTGEMISQDDEIRLRQYARQIIIKGTKSLERLLAELTLFLHQAEASLPGPQQNMIRKFYSSNEDLNLKKVLLVDDDPRNSFAMSSRLEENGLEVLQAFDGHKALQMLHGNPRIDLVLMDIMLPGIDGYETIKKIRQEERFTNLPIIALTAKAMKEDRKKCIDAGANDYMTKPVDFNKLISLLRVWLQ
ncbi:MAG: response regulator [SAR324 cluster bacterium]|nr:response regulator [SAR324 cluster bacterium]